METRSGMAFVIQVVYLMIYLIVSYVIVHYFVKVTPFLIPLSILFLLFITVNIGTGAEEYRVTEYMLPVGCLVNILIVVVPSQWSINSLAFVLGMLYYIHQMHSNYGVVPVPLLMAIWLATMYFTFTSWILFRKLRTLYKLLRENQKLNKEMKRLLQIFPEGVIISTKDTDDSSKSSIFTNHEFSSHICDIRNRLEELQNIDITYVIKNKDENKDLSISTSLHAFLKAQEEKLTDNNIIEHNNVQIKCLERISSRRFQHDTENSDEPTVRNFNVKTLQVNWEGNKNAFMHVFIDTTDIRKLEEANNNIKCQKIMFASVSHEFRTPLNAILNSYRFIETTFQSIMNECKAQSQRHGIKICNTIVSHSEKMKKFISMGSNSSILLLSLIEDILDLSKMEGGTFKINMEKFSVEELVNEVFDIFYFQCLLKKIKLELKVAQNVRGITAYSDKGRIKQVLLNLLSNSFKFTFKGGIKISVKLVKEEKVYIVFSVRDTGIGVKKEDQSGLFKLFGMISSKNNLNPNGCGIGLTVSKKYIEHLDGDIELTSTYGVGTKVKVFIPLLKPPRDERPLGLSSINLPLADEDDESVYNLPKVLSEDKYNFGVKTFPA